MCRDVCKYSPINEVPAKTEAAVLPESEKLHVRSKLPHAPERKKKKNL